MASITEQCFRFRLNTTAERTSFIGETPPTKYGIYFLTQAEMQLSVLPTHDGVFPIRRNPIRRN